MPNVWELWGVGEKRCGKSGVGRKGGRKIGPRLDMQPVREENRTRARRTLKALLPMQLVPLPTSTSPGQSAYATCRATFSTIGHLRMAAYHRMAAELGC